MTTEHTSRDSERIDQWLKDGGLVITSTNRAAHAIRRSIEQLRIAEGAQGWEEARILEWNAFVREEFAARTHQEVMVLNRPQEEYLWASIAVDSNCDATILHGSRYRLASMALEAYELLCSHAPDLLHEASRAGWSGNAKTFNEWLGKFEAQCEAAKMLSPAMLPIALTRLLDETSTESADERPALLLVGFDKELPAQKDLLAKWGRHEFFAATPVEGASSHYYRVADPAQELQACALWCRRKLEADPSARLLVVSQEAGSRRGEIERAFARYLNPARGAMPPVEFSLGSPLSRVPLVRGAMTILRWLYKPVAEHELDWLIATGILGKTAEQTAALQRHMRLLRQKQRQRSEWTLKAFLASLDIVEGRGLGEWAIQMKEAAALLDPFNGNKRPHEWSDLVPSVLEKAGWPGTCPVTSANYQALKHWSSVLDLVGTLGFDGAGVNWAGYFSALARNLEHVLFSAESTEESILVIAPTQSTGLNPDGIWFLGAEEDSWPMNGTTHPFLPIGVQKEAGMPHSSVEVDAELSRTITLRLIESCPEVVFSSAKLRGKIDSSPSHMIVELVGEPVEAPADLLASAMSGSQSIASEDLSLVPFTGAEIHGGARVLSLQSQCPFRAFAEARLGARPWDPAESGLSPRERGDFVHMVLNSIWGGTRTSGWSSSRELVEMLQQQGKDGLEKFVRSHVDTVVQKQLPGHLKNRLSSVYLGLECDRLVNLVREWLLYEATRAPFTVAGTEQKTEVNVAGLGLKLRLDRLDTLDDGSSLVVDYKTGQASPKDWAGPRPEDVQLPLYATCALPCVPGKNPGGLVFASLQAGNTQFAGKVRSTDFLIPGLAKSSALVKDPLTDEFLDQWRQTIEALATDFLAGKAQADPASYPETCEYCKLQCVCRIEGSRSSQAV